VADNLEEEQERQQRRVGKQVLRLGLFFVTASLLLKFGSVCEQWLRHSPLSTYTR
jgi:hypothetical protein